MAYKAEAVFPIMYFKAEAVIGRRFLKIVILECIFLHLSKPGEMPVTDFTLVVYLSVLPACYFSKGWTPCQIIYKVYDYKSCYFVKHISMAGSAALKIKILLVPVNSSLAHQSRCSS